MYATCEACKQEMTLTNGCKVSHWQEADGSTTARVPFGQDNFPGVNCPDCNTPRGSFHHAGCDIERCGRCGLQAWGCPCSDVGELEA